MSSHVRGSGSHLRGDNAGLAGYIAQGGGSLKASRRGSATGQSGAPPSWMVDTPTALRTLTPWRRRVCRVARRKSAPRLMWRDVVVRSIPISGEPTYTGRDPPPRCSHPPSFSTLRALSSSSVPAACRRSPGPPTPPVYATAIAPKVSASRARSRSALRPAAAAAAAGLTAAAAAAAATASSGPAAAAAAGPAAATATGGRRGRRRSGPRGGRRHGRRRGHGRRRAPHRRGRRRRPRPPPSPRLPPPRPYPPSPR